MTTFSDPIELIIHQDRFSTREVGLVHPDTRAFIRLRNNGDIEISCGSSISILMSPRSRSITIVGDAVKLNASNLRWNRVIFNDQATTYQEPLFVDDEGDTADLYQGVSYFMGDEG